MCERKAWSKEQDDLLKSIMGQEGDQQGQRKLRWNDIAARISDLGAKISRKGKQCRERWFNQLHPDIVKEQAWLPHEEETLFSLQEKHGNHWAKISRGLPGRSDNSIKNYFYSCLRKALRKVNNYVYNNKRLVPYKNIKPFQKSTLSKILAVAENKAENKVSIAKEDAPLIARDIKKLLVAIQIAPQDQSQEHNPDIMTSVVSKIQEFNRICKRKKTKKKVTLIKEASSFLSPDVKESYLSEVEDLKDSQCSKQPSDFEAEEQILAAKREKKILEEKSWHQKVDPSRESFKYSSSQSLDLPKKLKTGVLIPTCKYNSSEGHPLHSSQPMSERPIQTTQIKHSNSTGGEPEGQKRPFLPYLPLFHSAYYHGSTFMPTVLPSKLCCLEGRHTFPFANSSFNLCPEWSTMERLNPFSTSDTKIKEQRSQSDAQK